MELKGLFICVMLLGLVALVRGYGEPDASNHPTYQERAMLVLSNIARIDPQKYKSVYMAGFSTDTSQVYASGSYPPVAPLYSEPKLNAASYSHSLDMATNNCFQHNSCDGTGTFVRVKNYYTCSGTLGENIAAGNLDVLASHNQWICDKSGNACAADQSSADGHRRNIMNANYKAVGNGYAYGSSSTYKHYWTQDFGGVTCAAISNPVYSASHYVKSGTTKFFAVYYSTSTPNPSSPQVNINGVNYALTRESGAVSGGSGWVFSQTSGTGCRNYYFTFGSVRYPDTGFLTTYGEGQCTTSFVASSTNPTSPPPTSAPPTSAPPTSPPPTSAPPTSAPPTSAPPTSAPPTSAPPTSAPPTSAPPTSPPPTSAPPTSAPPTVGPTPPPTSAPTSHSIYFNGNQNSWTAYANRGATAAINQVYNGKNSVKAIVTSSQSTNFIMFNRNPGQANTFSNVYFSIAGPANSKVSFYHNGGYVKSITLTPTWKSYSYPVSSLTGRPLSELKSFVFANGQSATTTFYVSEFYLM